MNAHRKTIEIRLNFDGANVDVAGWPLMRRFMDEFTKALHAMPSATRPEDILPTSVHGGSIGFTLAVPPAAQKDVRTLSKGPTRTWTPKMREAAHSFYRFLGDLNASLSVAIGHKVYPFTLPENKKELCITQVEVLRGVVFRVGGKDGDVEIRVEHDGVIKFKTGKGVAESLGQLLYQTVEVVAETQRDSATLTVESAKLLVHNRSSPRAETTDILPELAECLGHEFRIDASEFMKEIRG